MRGSMAKTLSRLLHSSLDESLTACDNMEEFKVLHAHIVTLGLSSDSFTTSRLISFCAVSERGDLDYANSIFTHTKNPSPFMWNTMIRGYSASSDPANSVRMYKQMLQNGIYPDNFTFPFLIKSCAVLRELRFGQGLHCQIFKHGLDLDVFVQNNLIHMYCSCEELGRAHQLFDEMGSLVDVISWTALVNGYGKSGNIEAARWFFDRMPCKNTVSWNAMVTAYGCSGDIVAARRHFNQMPQKNAVSWSGIISAYTHHGEGKEAIVLFEMMLQSGMVPNEAAIESTISACSQLKLLDEVQWLQRYVEEHGFKLNVILGCAFLDAYGKCGSIELAKQIFGKMPKQNLHAWNSMIAGFSMNGFAREALSLFSTMEAEGVLPNAATFAGLLSGCSHSGLVSEGRRLFDSMSRDYGIKPQLQHYGCMVDLLGRAGLLKEAMAFIENMPIKPHVALWGALLGACKIHNDNDLAEEVGMRIIELVPHDSGRYIQLSNIYASQERWDKVTMIRNLKKARGVIGTPGCSSSTI